MRPLYPFLALSFLILAGCGGAVTQAEEAEPTVPDGLGGRAGNARERLVREGGGNAKSESGVAAGLKWLAAHQALDGHWSLHDFHKDAQCNCSQPGREEDVAGTALALLPFLGAGETHQAAGNNRLYTKVVERALKWLIARQQPDGGFSKDDEGHALATLAICEAYGLTGDPILKRPAQAALDRCLARQQADGGFQAKRPEKDDDLLIDGWYFAALKSGRLAGLQVPNASMASFSGFLDGVDKQPKLTPTATAVMFYCRQHLGWGPRNPALIKGVETIEKTPPGAIRHITHYYFATQVLFHAAGKGWETWNPAIRDLLIKEQDEGKEEGRAHQKGSWSAAKDAREKELGRVGATAFGVLILEVYYRHLPLYRREMGAMKDEAIRAAVNAGNAALVNGDPQAQRTDQFAKFVPNAFLRSTDQPLSTFSIDVDTASYSIVRRFLLEEKSLPPQDAVRIEELVNYFDYSYPQPKGDHPVSITPEVSACPWHKDHRLVRIAVQGRDVDPTNLPPRNLVFLVDVSGSMSSEDRLPLVKKSLHLLIDQLNAKDKVALVLYAGDASVGLESTPGSDKDTIRKAVDGLHAGGSTNGGGGIVAAYDEALKNFIPGGVNRVILATDGDFNVGVTSEGELIRLIEAKRDKGIFLTALGYGMGNLKDSTIMKLADHGHGHYAYIDTLQEARKVFVDDGMSLIALAKDVKIQVEFNPKTVAAYQLIGYEKRLMAAQDFNDDTKHAAVMGCGHRVTALYEVVLAGKPIELPKTDGLKYQLGPSLSDAANSGELLTVKLRYKEPLGDKSQLVTESVKDATAFDKASTDFRFAAAVAAFAILLRDNPKDAGINLAGVAELAESAKGKDARGLRKEFIELVKKADGLAKQNPAKP